LELSKKLTYSRHFFKKTLTIVTIISKFWSVKLTQEFFMKKVLAAALLCTVSSAFATWDLFPAQEAGKGEAKLGFQYGIPKEKYSTMGLNLGARYSIIEGLEAALLLNGISGGYVISTSYDGEDAKQSGLDKPVIGVRYWLPMGLGIAVDAILPFGGKDLPWVGEEPQFGLNAGVQFSTKFTEELSLGSEALVTVINKLNKDFSNGMDLEFALELDYSLGAVTPFLGVDLQAGLSKGDKQEASKMKMGLSVGTIYDISESMYADAGFWMGLTGDEYKDYAPKTIYVDYGIKF
jgi:opacity protein-like surface antigen